MRREKIADIFSTLFLNDVPRAESSNDRLLRGKDFYEIKTWVCNRISLLWRHVFELYGWRMCTSYYKYNLINKDKKTVVMMQNSYSSANNGAKENTKYHLSKFKKHNPDWTVVYGAVNYRENLDYTEGDLRYLIGDPFLEFMLGDDHKEIESLLVSLFSNLTYL